MSKRKTTELKQLHKLYEAFRAARNETIDYWSKARKKANKDSEKHYAAIGNKFIEIETLFKCLERSTKESD